MCDVWTKEFSIKHLKPGSWNLHVLFQVVRWWKESGRSRFDVYKYHLQRITGQPPLTTNQVEELICFAILPQVLQYTLINLKDTHGQHTSHFTTLFTPFHIFILCRFTLSIEKHYIYHLQKTGMTSESSFSSSFIKQDWLISWIS